MLDSITGLHSQWIDYYTLPIESRKRLKDSREWIGFEPSCEERVFEVFQRLHSNDHYEGTGIGLLIVKKIVERRNNYYLHPEPAINSINAKWGK